MSNLPPPPPPSSDPQPPPPGAAPAPAPGFGAPPPPAPSFGTPTVVAPAGLTTSPLGIGVWATLAIAAVCSFLPWATLEGFGESLSKNGTEGDGVITLILSIAAAALFFGYTRNGRKGFAIGSIVVAALSALVYVIDLADVSGQFDGGEIFEVKAGIGLIGGTIAAIAALVLLVVVVVKGNKPRP